jgi:RNA polymerase sigma factor
MLGGLRVTGKLPVKELTERCSVSRKTVERNRKYIIAVAIMLSGAYPFMHDYLQQQPNDQSDYKQEASK